eukprot:s1037_g4.t1
MWNRVAQGRYSRVPLEMHSRVESFVKDDSILKPWSASFPSRAPEPEPRARSSLLVLLAQDLVPLTEKGG